jgi:hypothetical protein
VSQEFGGEEVTEHVRAKNQASGWEEEYCGFIQIGPARATRKLAPQWRPDDDREDIDKRSLELNDEILVCRRANEILAMVDKRGAEYGAVNATTALHRIAKMPDRQVALHSPQLLPLASKVLVLLQQSGFNETRGLGNTAWAFA